jgi:hypothetical protein
LVLAAQLVQLAVKVTLLVLPHYMPMAALLAVMGLELVKMVAEVVQLVIVHRRSWCRRCIN